MVLPSNSLPADQSWVAREIAAMKQQVKELSSSVAGLPAIQSQVAFLLDQFDEDVVTGGSTSTTSTAASPSWLPFDPSVDASLSVAASSTGKMVISSAGRATVTSIDMEGYAWIGMEVLDDGNTQVSAPRFTDGLMVFARSGVVGLTGAGLARIVRVVPGMAITVRCRRAYGATVFGASPSCTVNFGATSISVAKVGA